MNSKIPATSAGFSTATLGRAPELLAPAGDMEAMRAAVANGADAVYFGLNNFNARHRAHNFTLEELPQVMSFLHGHNVKGFVTLNTLIFSDELEEALRFVRAIAEAGADAVIVQDLGLARLIHRMCPGLHVHGSTQMTLTEPLGIEFVRKLGVVRVVLARELSTTDIRKISLGTDLPVEVFVHGALCVSYSGQCLTSESLGGRSANRGQCAQACRLPYELIVDGQVKPLGDKAYLLSPQDLAAHDLIGDLTELGVASFKIEGRLKSAHYVAATTQTYRGAIDAAVSNLKFEMSRQQSLDLAQSFSRGFSHGFLDGVNHQELVHARFPKSRGVLIGKVTGTTDGGVLVQLGDVNDATLARHGFATDNQIHIGDGVVFDEGHPDQDEQGGRVASIRAMGGSPMSSHLQKKGMGGPPMAREQTVEITFERGGVNLDAIAYGSLVWKTNDPTLRRRMESTFNRDKVARRVPLHAQVTATIGGPLVIIATDNAGHAATVTWPGPLQAAQKFPLTETLFREQFGRLGETPFELGPVTGLKNGSGAMAPKSVLNDLRRQATEQLLRLRDGAESRAIVEPDVLERVRAQILASSIGADMPVCHEHSSPSPAEDAAGPHGGQECLAQQKPTSAKLHVLVRTLDQLRSALVWKHEAGQLTPSTVYCDFEDIRKYKEAVPLANAAGIPIGIATVRIIKPGEEGLLKQVADCKPDIVLIRNLTGLAWFTKYAPHLPLVADYALNIANEVTAALLAEHGVKRMVPSYDLNFTELVAMAKRFPPAAFEAVIHQHMPMFHMEHCVFCHTLSEGTSYKDCGRPCDVHQVDLNDRAGAAHPLIADVGCRNTVYNGTAQSGAEYVPRMREMGIVHFRVELLRELPEEVAPLLDRYACVVAGLDDGRQAWRQLKVLSQLGVTRGTLGE